MSDWGIKVSNAGTSILSTDIRDQIMNSQYAMFKYHSDGTVGVPIAAGSTVAYGTVAHNLGYVPAFMSYVNYSGDSLQRLVPSIPYGVSFEHYANAYADTANIVVSFNLTEPYGQTEITATDYYNTFWGDNEAILIGRTGDVPTLTGSTGRNGAIRFGSVAVTGSETITSAKIEIYVGNKNGSTSQHVRWNNYGIDEDNTQSFNDPFSRDRTTATSASDRTVPASLGDEVEIDVTTMFDEIRQRAGWSSGNAMGFTMLEDGSDDSSSFWDSIPPYSYLRIQRPGTATIPFRVIIFKDKIV